MELDKKWELSAVSPQHSKPPPLASASYDDGDVIQAYLATNCSGDAASDESITIADLLNDDLQRRLHHCVAMIQEMSDDSYQSLHRHTITFEASLGKYEREHLVQRLTELLTSPNIKPKIAEVERHFMAMLHKADPTLAKCVWQAYLCPAAQPLVLSLKPPAIRAKSLPVSTQHER